MTSTATPRPPGDGEGAGNDIRHTIAVASGKGGVGKSTVSVNLAVALAQHGARVGLLDADLYGPSIPKMTGATGTPAQVGGLIEPLTAHGVRLMSLGFLIPEGTPTIWRGPMVANGVQQLLREVAWGTLDYLLVDLPPGTGDAQLTLAEALTLRGAVIVTTPQTVAAEIARKALSMFRQLEVPILGLLENMSGFQCPHCGAVASVFKQGGGRAASEALGVPFLGAVPLDPGLCLAGDAGVPIVAGRPESPAAAAFQHAARAIEAAVAAEAVRPERTQAT